MSTIVFIKPNNYNQSLVGTQLVSILENSVYVDGNWCCYTDPLRQDELTVNITQDNLSYMINNFLLAKRYEHIIVSYPYPDDEDIFSLITHLKSEGRQISIFHFSDTTLLSDVENLELLNSEYQTEYKVLDNGQMVKLSYVDTTNMSAFKIAKVLESILFK